MEHLRSAKSRGDNDDDDYDDDNDDQLPVRLEQSSDHFLVSVTISCLTSVILRTQVVNQPGLEPTIFQTVKIYQQLIRKG